MMGLPPFGSVARMNEALMADEQVASCKGLGADVAHERLLLGVSSTDVPLVCAAARLRMLELPDVPLEMFESCEEALAVRTWQSLGLGSLRLPLDTACGRCMGVHIVCYLDAFKFGVWGKRKRGCLSVQVGSDIISKLALLSTLNLIQSAAWRPLASLFLPMHCPDLLGRHLFQVAHEPHKHSSRQLYVAGLCIRCGFSKE